MLHSVWYMSRQSLQRLLKDLTQHDKREPYKDSPAAHNSLTKELLVFLGMSCI